MPLELSVSKLWRNGPEWLKSTINNEPLPEEVPQSSATEMKARQWRIQRAQGAPAPLVQLNNSSQHRKQFYGATSILLCEQRAYTAVLSPVRYMC